MTTTTSTPTTMPTPSSKGRNAPAARGETETFDVSIAKSTLGSVLVASSRAGIAAVLIGDDRSALRADLARRFPRAELRNATDRQLALAARVIDAVDHPERAAAPIPLDPRGTDFQRAVWRALREIPPGTTATYGEIAKRIGQPAAIRGVAQACAANPIAVLVPCHRVVRSDGGLSGYRWGVERKRALLEREAREARAARR